MDETISVTNRKVAGLGGLRWASFGGFSLLFDNPGESVSPMGRGWLKVDCSVHADPNLKLYGSFARSLGRMGQDLLSKEYLFCPLPPYSYHVTAWDGLNDGNTENVFSDYRLDLEHFLRGLPDSLLADEKFAGEIGGSPLVTRTGWTIRFRFDTLAKWGNRVLVARLTPADEESRSALTRIIADREELTGRFQRVFGVRTCAGYSPHVSLGYFANSDYAERATLQVDRWTEVVGEEVGDLAIAFGSISLYGFTDMATLFRRANRCSDR